MKILLLADLHGKIPKIKTKDFDIILSPGDICEDKYHRKYVDLWLKEIKKGYKKSAYAYMEETLTEKQIEKLEQKRINGGKKLLKNLAKQKKPVYWIPGNWDGRKDRTHKEEKTLYQRYSSLYNFFFEKTDKDLKDFENVENIHFKIKKLPYANLIGVGRTMHPEYTKEVLENLNEKEKEKLTKKYEKIKQKIRSLYEKRDKTKPTIIISHNSPYKTKLDKINSPGSPAHNKHIGSTISKWMIKELQPDLFIGSHVHEAKGKIKIGKTTCVNTGFGPEINYVVDTKKMSIKEI
ncbi:MAG: metallophosphoesterase family protein [Candidatus Woesearchaeota archaeon]